MQYDNFWVVQDGRDWDDIMVAFLPDRDEDGLPDVLEDTMCTNPDLPDTDEDGLVDGVEDANHNGLVDDAETDPCEEDTDADGINDGDERTFWGEDWDEDPDGDGLINLVDPDSDNDGFKDGLEIARGYDPSDPDSHPPRALIGIYELLLLDE